MILAKPNRRERAMQRCQFQAAIIEAAEVFGTVPGGGWGHKSPFVRTAEVLRSANPGLGIDKTVDRLHAALFTVGFLNTFVILASQERLFRFPVGEAQERAEFGASSLPPQVPPDLSKSEFEEYARRLQRPTRARRMHPDSARVLKGYVGHEAQATWAVEFFGQAMAHAFEDLTCKTAGLISETAKGRRGPSKSFTGFMNSITSDLFNADALPSKHRLTFEGMEAQDFVQAVRTITNYKQKGWGRIVDIAMSDRPPPFDHGSHGTAVTTGL